MTSRERILNTIKTNKPAELPLPEVPLFGESNPISLHQGQFQAVLTSIGGRVVEIKDENEIVFFIKENFPNALRIVSNVVESNFNVHQNTSTEDLALVDVVILRGSFGVAENGAIWLPESAMMHRALPIITQHLCLILNKKNIVSNMHHAYSITTHQALDDYGIFIAGPSKTADIEQSLVIGAHGARSMTVFFGDF